MARLLSRGGHPIDVLAMAERAKARVLVEILRGPKLDPAAQMTHADRATAERLDGEITDLNRQTAFASKANPPAGPHGRLH